MKPPRLPFMITPKGRAVLHGPSVWGLSTHLRDVLALCDPQASFAQLQQWLPPESLRCALYALRELGLLEGPALQAPELDSWIRSRLRAGQPASARR